MASLERRNQTYRVVFMFRGRRAGFSLNTGDRQTAEALVGGVEKTLMLIDQGALVVPEDADIVAFVRSGGRTPQEPAPAAPPATTFGAFKEQYLATHGQGAMEANSLDTIRMHLGHFEKSLGARFSLQDLAIANLQQHVNRRQEKKYRGKKLSPVTLKKEMASFRAAWNWATHMGLVKGPFPSKGLVFPKTDEKLPFMTWSEIERKVASVSTKAQKDELWDCLYLTQAEIAGLLQYVEKQAAHGWLYPLCCFAAHTGARRSEILRVLVDDVDFDGMTVLIREKKRSRKQRTTRRVPLTPFLAGVLQDWLRQHPGGPNLFGQAAEITRSKKRSKTTGHQWGKGRAKSAKGRLATVQARGRKADLEPLTRNEVHDHFKRTLAEGKWQVLRGLHLLRHSFISACASRGVDQRLIDDWVGHQTEEQRKRYRHLFPSVQQTAIRSVFEGE